MNKYVTSFLDYLINERQSSQYTIIAYEKDIRDFMLHLQQQGIENQSVDLGVAEGYLFTLLKQNIKRRSIARKISSLRSYFKFLVRNDFLKSNPFLNLETQKYQKNLPTFLSLPEITRLLEINISDDPLINQRNWVIIHLLYGTGVRVSELTSIRVDDIDNMQKQIKVMGKGRKERFVFINDYAYEYLTIYLRSVRPELMAKYQQSHDYVIVNNRGQALTNRGVELIVKRMGEELNPPKSIYPHMLRHSFATHLMDNGMDIRSVQELLGHKSLSATQVYTHISIASLRKVYDQAHPRANKKRQ
jgi:integrase/recombinase XerC